MMHLTEKTSIQSFLDKNGVPESCDEDLYMIGQHQVGGMLHMILFVRILNTVEPQMCAVQHCHSRYQNTDRIIESISMSSWVYSRLIPCCVSPDDVKLSKDADALLSAHLPAFILPDGITLTLLKAGKSGIINDSSCKLSQVLLNANVHNPDSLSYIQHGNPIFV